ncbi:glycoside hydrolase [Pseudoflavitalea sp. G-6-1-2]|uniref:glycoside hydrolase family 28 protein n=1 Tax=Pseudoflavitalea sp. G-6-1-2 TaxID=2728841 RepID=UPI00146DB2E8|nr:glycosyl hydrolase family 28 protein [Pseudoflavitalea sp. G-6-1-2]NML21754.1 glycoside hydrolase [Pseudoflavitalea sp. G-6-1-2]
MSQQYPDPISRRQLFGKMVVPALGIAGLSAIASEASANDHNLSHHVSAASNTGVSPLPVYNIRDYGAKGDGETLDTAAVQAAIDDCHKNNGGVVLIPAGDFLIATLQLKSFVTLHLSPKGKLVGSKTKAHYSSGKGVPPGNGNMVLLYAVEAERICIEGQGTIDGNGAAFNNGRGDGTGPNGIPGNMDRPHLLILYKCKHVIVRDAFFTNSAYHCFRILHCANMQINGLRIHNRVNRNNDGFHFNDSEYVHISNCDVACQDDACALFGSNQFITVTNCTFSTRWSIFRFGGGKAQNITVTNCVIMETYGCPIKISTGRGQLENFIFSNIIMRNVTGPIGIGFSGESRNNKTNSNEASFVRNILFSNIQATVVTRPIDHPEIPFVVKPFPGEDNTCITLNAMNNVYLENIRFSDIHVRYAGGGTAAQAAKRDVPTIASEYFGVWGKEPYGPPAYGLYARNVKGLSLNNVRFEFDQPDLRPAIVMDNVQDASISGLQVMADKEAESALRFINCKEIFLSSPRLLNPAKVFLQLEGNANEGILLQNGDLRKATQQITYTRGADKKAIVK